MHFSAIMKKIILTIIIFAVGAAVWLAVSQTSQQAISMKLTSSAFLHNSEIPSKYTCDGENINPPLGISGVPEGAKSVALISDDPDAPAGTWVHWTLWNISTATAEIPENSAPEGAIEGKTSFGKLGYGGPCPPSGTHRYFFKLYALDTIVNLDSSASKEDVLSAIEGHILDQAELIGTYRRR